MNDAFPVRLVAVVGGSGSGKTWLASRLCRLLGDRACHLSLDDFYRDRSHLPPARRARINFDVPHAVDWDWAARVLRQCCLGESADVPRYDFATHSRLAVTRPWEPRPIVFVDGLWLLRRPAVRQLFDLKIYLDASAELRRQRRLARDVVQRGYAAHDIELRFDTAVLPMHERYVEPQKRHADIVLTEPYAPAEMQQLADRLWTLLDTSGLVEPWMHETFRAELLATLIPYEPAANGESTVPARLPVPAPERGRQIAFTP